MEKSLGWLTFVKYVNSGLQTGSEVEVVYTQSEKPVRDVFNVIQTSTDLNHPALLNLK